MLMRKTDTYLDDDDNIEILDGGSVRVPLTIMDAMQRRFATFDARLHQPGYRIRTADAASHDRAAARMEWIANFMSAWVSPAQRSTTVAARDSDADPIAARDAMIERLTKNWCSPAGGSKDATVASFEDADRVVARWPTLVTSPKTPKPFAMPLGMNTKTD